MTASVDRRRLSVAILVRDAAEPLRLTLASIRDIADEIVVVDTGSSDRSRDVAREFGAQVSECAWTDDFSAARNFALRQAHGEWLLWLDAGETLGDPDARDLKDFVVGQADANQAYLLVVRLPPSDPSSPAEQVARIRLIPNRPGIQFAGRVGESPAESLAALKIALGGLPYVVRRGEREHDARFKKQRAQRKLAIAEVEVSESGGTARVWNCMGESLQAVGDNLRAVDCFRQALRLAQRGSPAMLEAYYGLLSSLESTHAAPAELLQVCVAAMGVFPTDAQLLCALGGYLQAQGKSATASQAYLTAYKFGQVNPLVWHVGEIRDIAAVCYSLLLQLQQQTDVAIQFLEESLTEHADSMRLRHRLIEIFVQQGDRDSALSHVGALPQSTPHREALRSAVRGACFAVQQNLIAAKAYLNAGYAHGCRDPICLKWLSLCLLSARELAEARPVLVAWKQVEPRNAEVDKLLAVLDQPAPTAPQANRRIDAPAVTSGGGKAPVKLDLPAWSPSANTR